MCDIDDQNTNYVFASKGTQNLYLTSNDWITLLYSTYYEKCTEKMS